MTDRVESAAPEPLGSPRQEVVHPFEHFAGGLVGEGQQKDLTRPVSLLKEPGDAVGEGAGLAAAGTCDHEMGSCGGGDGLELLVVERFREIDRAPASGGGVELVAPAHREEEGV